MAARKIIWTQKANIERRDILEYSIDRNKSKKIQYQTKQAYCRNYKANC